MIIFEIISLYSSSLFSKLDSSTVDLFDHFIILHPLMQRIIVYVVIHIMNTREKIAMSFLKVCEPVLCYLTFAIFMHKLLTKKVLNTEKKVSTMQNPQPNPITFGTLSVNYASWSGLLQNSVR